MRCDALEATGELGNVLSFCCSAAQALLAVGREDETERSRSNADA